MLNIIFYLFIKSTVFVITEVYTYEKTCELWQIFGVHAAKMGYQPFKRYNCTGFIRLRGPVARPILTKTADSDKTKKKKPGIEFLDHTKRSKKEESETDFADVVEHSRVFDN